jgi:hypothetical protein
LTDRSPVQLSVRLFEHVGKAATGAKTREAELAVGMREVRLDGLEADVELLGDLGVGRPRDDAQDQLQKLAA